jgi:hypothetical protein
MKAKQNKAPVDVQVFAKDLALASVQGLDDFIQKKKNSNKRNTQDYYFKNGIDLISVSVKYLGVEVSLTVAGPKSAALSLDPHPKTDLKAEERA